MIRWHVIRALILKYFYISLNRLDRLFEVVYWPAIGLLLWGFTTYYLRDFVGQDIINIFIGGTIMWIFFQRATQDISIFVLEDFWSRNLYNLFAAPVRALELVLSVMGFGILRSIITFLFLFILALLLYSFNIFNAGIFAVVVFAGALLLTGWVYGLVISAFIFNFGMRIQVLSWSVPFIVQAFSAVFYPVNSLPNIIRLLSLTQPSTYVFEGMRMAFATGTFSWYHASIAYGLNLLLFIPAAIFFTYSIKRAKRLGLFVQNE